MFLIQKRDELWVIKYRTGFIKINLMFLQIDFGLFGAPLKMRLHSCSKIDYIAYSPAAKAINLTPSINL